MSNTDQWQWWHSHDGGERFHGPCASREDAITDGRDYADGEPFIICEATKGGLHDFIDGRVAEWLDESNHDNSDPDGDPISASISKAEWEDLDKRLTLAADEWRRAHNIDRHVWAFADTRDEETIEGEDHQASDDHE